MPHRQPHPGAEADGGDEADLAACFVFVVLCCVEGVRDDGAWLVGVGAPTVWRVFAWAPITGRGR